MYRFFKLPEDFLNRKYTQVEKDHFNEKIYDALYGHHLLEELTPKQKRMVDKHDWTSPVARSAHDKVFGMGSDRIFEDYDPGDTKIDHHNYRGFRRNVNALQDHTSAVMHALERHGYHVTDYVDGKAVKSDELGSERPRVLSIGKIMNKHGITDNETYVQSKTGKRLTLGQAYASDPLRASGKKGGLKIAYTRNSYDVAGMSTDRGWTSCMDLAKGWTRHNKHLKADLEHGTVTAYATHQDDQNIHRPIGRVNLKRYTGNDGHVIYRPESSAYGTVPPRFRHQVKQWAEKNYPMKDSMYMKEPSLYDDDGKTVLFNKNKIAKTFETTDKLHRHLEQMSNDFESAANHAYEQHHDKDGYNEFDHEEFYNRAMGHHVNSVMESLDERGKQNLYLHSAYDADHYGDGEAHKSDEHLTNFEHSYDGGIDVNHSLAVHAHVQKHTGALDLDHLTHEDIAHHLGRFREIGDLNDDTGDEDKYEESRSVHHSLLEEAGRRLDKEGLDDIMSDVHDQKDRKKMNPETKSKIVEHLLHHHTEADERYESYRDKMHEDYGPPIDIGEVITHTTNTAHHRLAVNHALSSDPNEHGYVWSDANMHHIGAHADAKTIADIIHAHVHHDHPLETRHLENMIMGSNRNPDGENIQHDLTSRFYLHGGEQPSGFPVTGVQKSYEREPTRFDYKPGGFDHERGDGWYLGMKGRYKEHGDPDHYQHALVHTIARATHFPSVARKLSERDDFPDDVKTIAKRRHQRLRSVKESVKISLRDLLT